MLNNSFHWQFRIIMSYLLFICSVNVDEIVKICLKCHRSLICYNHTWYHNRVLLEPHIPSKISALVIYTLCGQSGIYKVPQEGVCWHLPPLLYHSQTHKSLIREALMMNSHPRGPLGGRIDTFRPLHHLLSGKDLNRCLWETKTVPSFNISTWFKGTLWRCIDAARWLATPLPWQHPVRSTPGS